MNIRPKNIPKFQGGGVPQWYLDRYGNRTALLGWDLNQRYNYADNNLMTNDHRNAGNLDMVYQKNLAYTGTPGAISSDIQAFYNSDGDGMSAEDFVNFYNDNAEKIRSHWAKDLTYNKRTAGEHNRLFRRMFLSRSNMSQSPGSAYNIGYQLGQTKGGYDIQDIEGSSTWLRRMDLYENEFDPNKPDSNRLHEITLKDGTKAIVYKKANGDIGLLPKQETPAPKPEEPAKPEDPAKPTGSLEEFRKEGGYGFDWSKIAQGIQQSLPGLFENVGLGLALDANRRIFNEKLKGIRPNLVQPYLTHRQIVGDEATKQAYYRRGAEGISKAAQPFTSDADRQMAYLNEAYRAKNELLAQGDIADNQEIRRTSDESNQHLWANTQRRTEVANENQTQLNYANAAKHDLNAQYIAANHASWDNFLKAREYRARELLEKAKEYQRQIWALKDLQELDNDDNLNNLKEIAEKALKEDPNMLKLDTKDKVKAVRTANYKAKERLLNRAYQREYSSPFSWFGTSYGKLGMKIIRKKKDDLLYKTARDVVEHFRKMSKMSDDSTLRSRHPGSRFKLTSHPKKMQQGGLAPFVVYTPVAMGGETSITRSSETGSSSSKSDSAKETLDLVKNLFKKVRGLPVDANNVYTYMQNFFAKAKAFGTELSTDDIASMYLQSMQQINNLKHSQDTYEKARAFATQQESLNEFAVDAMGNFIVQDKDGKLSKESSWLKVLESGKNPLTNEQLLYMRAYDLDLAFNKGDNLIMNTIFNGTGINKIGAQIKALAGSIGSSDSKIDGITKVESNKIKAGLELLANAPEGYYKITLENKTQLEQVKAAFNFIKSQLSRSLLAILESHGGADYVIANALNSRLDITNNISISPLTGKAAKDDKDSLDKISSNPLLAMQREIGGNPINYSIVTRDSNTKMSVNGTSYPSLPKVKSDMSIDNMLSTSGMDQIVLSKQGITFGDQQINPENLKDIMYANSGRNAIVTLPCKIVNGVKQVNLAVRDEYEKAELKAANLAPRGSQKYLEILGKELKEAHLDSLLDSNGLPNKNMFSEFLIVEAYTTDKIKFDNKNSLYIEKVNNPNSDLENRINLALSTDNKKSDYKIDIKDKFALFELTYNDVYRGTVFIPINNNPAAAMLNDTVKVGLSLELEELYLISNKSNKYVKDNSF